MSTRYELTRAFARDPFALARDIFSWEPMHAGRAGSFLPSFEVKETTEAFVVRGDVPGVSEKDLDISVHNSVLTISGKRTSEERKEGESFLVYERQFGSFSRSFSLPDTADGDRIEAKLEAGILTLSIGKKVEAKPKRIAIKST